jgi:hypothetical protein
VYKNNKNSLNSRNKILKDNILETRLSKFWLHVTTEYPEFDDEAILSCCHFQLHRNRLFPAMAMKTKHRSRLCTNKDWRLSDNNQTPQGPSHWQNASSAITLMLRRRLSSAL